MFHIVAPVAIAVILAVLLVGAARVFDARGGHPAQGVAWALLFAAFVWLVLEIIYNALNSRFGFIHWPVWLWLLLFLAAVVVMVATAARSFGAVLLAALIGFVVLFGNVVPASARAKEPSVENCAKQKHERSFDAESKQCIPTCNAITTYHPEADDKGHHCLPTGPIVGGPASTTPTTTPPDCGVDGIKQVDSPHDGGQVDSRGFPKDATPQQKRDSLLASMGQATNGTRTADAVIVMLFWDRTDSGSADPVTDYHQLLDNNGCFNARGKQVAHDTVLLYKDVPVVAATAPANAVNTGANASGPFQGHAGPIAGDRSGILITLRSGKKVWVMDRCKNLVTEEEIKGVTFNETTATTVATVVTNTTPTMRSVSTTVATVVTSTTRTTVPSSTTTTVPVLPKCADVPAGRACVDVNGVQHQPLTDNSAAVVAPTSGFSPSGNATVEAAQHTTDPAATSGNIGTQSGVNTGNHETSSNIPVSADTNNPGTPPGSNAGISAPVTADPDQGQTNGGPSCTPSTC